MHDDPRKLPLLLLLRKDRLLDLRWTLWLLLLRLMHDDPRKLPLLLLPL
jgi:hypothetical protein